MIRSFRVLCLAGLCLGCQAPPEAESDRVYAEALSLLHQGRFSESEALFRRVVSLAPDSAIAQIRLGEALLRQGRWQSAGRQLDELPTPARQRPEARLLEARLLAFGGFAREAELAVNEIRYLDLYVANGVTGTDTPNALLHNQQNGAFLNVATAAAVADSGQTIGTAAGDFDGDGLTDLYAVNIGQLNRLYRNLGDGTFADVAERAGVLFPVEGGYVAFFFDLDNDGHLDLFASTMSAFPDVLNSMVTGEAIEPNRPFLYRNLGDGTFADIAVAAGLKRSFGSMGAGLGDLDNDGFVDIYLANGGPQMARLEPNALFRNMGDGTFADITATAGTGSLGKGHGATFADFDQDGDLDLYAGLGGHYDADTWDNALYRNDGPAQHYLSIELVGTQANRSAIGAHVAAFAAGRTIRAQRQSGFGFGSSNEPLLHLGLGSATRVDSLHVLWPGQPPQRFFDLPVDCRIRIAQREAHYQMLRRSP
ncbi:MAG: tetratricopeptide repeat protein [Gemmatimonadetes bacterium]|nr:tetratricopeptide repeat protein [Gemmatimonadota bacterium]MYB70007.1 tetratricopeptide repeat protein [Gemmatimonadota bacterium]